jgi:hypothetical protein
MRVADANGDAGAIRWALRCANRDAVLADLPLRTGTAAIGFDVPAGCDAQWLELNGIAGDTPQTTELTIRDLHLAAGDG